MANQLPTFKKDELREKYHETGSIRAVAKAIGIGRNTVRRLLRAEGLIDLSVKPLLSKEPKVGPLTPLVEPSLQKLDFLMLEKMFAGIEEPGPTKDYETQIKSLAIDVGKELGVHGRIDVLRIEVAVANYISWRRFYFRSLDAGDKNYCGPYAKYHDKVAKAADRWVSASNKAFDQMNRLFRELEAKYGKRGPDLGRNNIFVQNQQVNVAGKT